MKERKPIYEIEFTDAQWDELVSMASDVFECEPGDALTRQRWMSLGFMALGKAERLADGTYDGDIDDNWANELRDIAAIIFETFQPGDGKL
jgi:hypothetical protein